MRENNGIWVVESGALQILEPEVIYESATDVLARDVAPGTLVISSQLEIFTEGMKVRMRETNR